MSNNQGQKFTSTALDKLINESIEEADQFEEELKKIDATNLTMDDVSFPTEDPSVVDTEKSWSETNNLIDKETGDAIAFNYVYRKIADLIDNGNATLQMIQSIDFAEIDPSLLGATASLMNSIKGCIGEFTKIHQQWIKFNQTIALEDKRLENRKKYLKYKTELQNESNNANMPQATELVDVKTSELVEYLQWKKEKEERERAKENKI